MTQRDKAWTGDEVRARLDTLDLSAVGKKTETWISGYHLAASVLSYFDPDLLEPIGDVDEADFTQLLKDSSVVLKPDGGSGWTLRPRARTSSLRQLARRGRLSEAIEANKSSSEPDSLREMLGLYWREKAPPPREQTLDQLTTSQEIVRLLNDDEVREELPEGVRRT